MEFIFWLIIIAIFVGVGYFFYKIFKTSFKRIGEIEKNKSDFNSKDHGTLKHISGLPLPKNVYVDVMYNDDKIIMKKDNTVISIAKSKVNSIDSTTGENIKNQAAGAVAGNYLIGGTGGAFIGAIIATKIYLVISYSSDGEDKYIILDEAESGFFSSRLIKNYKKTIVQEERNIEL